MTRAVEARRARQLETIADVVKFRSWRHAG